MGAATEARLGLGPVLEIVTCITTGSCCYYLSRNISDAGYKI